MPKSSDHLVDWQVEVDARGLLCPLPVLRARKRLLAMAEGEVLALRATDPAAIVDVPHFCTQSGQIFLEFRDEGESQLYLIRRGASAHTS